MAYYPPVGYHFRVDFEFGNGADGPNEASFKEVSGLVSELEVDKYQEGGENGFQHPLPKPAKFNHLSLKRGMLTNSKLIQWFQDAIEHFDITPKDLKVVLLDDRNEPLVTWVVENAYPIKWEISGFNAMENSLVIESVEFALRRYRRLATTTPNAHPN